MCVCEVFSCSYILEACVSPTTLQWTIVLICVCVCGSPTKLWDHNLHPTRAFPSFFFFCITDHPYFVGVQYHPEYLSRPLAPSAPYLGLILASSKKLNGFISRGYQLSPRASYEYDPDSELDDEVTQALGRASAELGPEYNTESRTASEVFLSAKSQ